MANYTVYFDCKHKFGSKKVQAENDKEAKIKAKPLIQNGAWCENRCDKCKLKLTT